MHSAQVIRLSQKQPCRINSSWRQGQHNLDCAIWPRILTLTSAPDAPGIISAILRRLMPRVRFILREWIFRISRRAYNHQPTCLTWNDTATKYSLISDTFSHDILIYELIHVHLHTVCRTKPNQSKSHSIMKVMVVTYFTQILGGSQYHGRWLIQSGLAYHPTCDMFGLIDSCWASELLLPIYTTGHAQLAENHHTAV